MPKRKWPTVPEILDQATRVAFRFLDDGRIAEASYDSHTQQRIGSISRGLAMHLHLGTAPNLLKAVAGAGWARRVDGEYLVFTPPAKTGVATAPTLN